DLPKGYQISQYALPLTSGGRLEVPVASEGTDVVVGITRAHLEEDTARLLHGGRGHTLVDFNRAGVPLMEIVTEPDIRSPAQARGWDEGKGRTIIQRSKEEANDYRYFPEPDLPPLRPSEAWVDELRARLPELPAARRARYERELGLSAYDAGVLTSDVALADYFDGVVELEIPPKLAANWVAGEFSRLLNVHA